MDAGEQHKQLFVQRGQRAEQHNKQLKPLLVLRDGSGRIHQQQASQKCITGNQGDYVPAAYLNYILFDQQYNVLDMGWSFGMTRWVIRNLSKPLNPFE